MPPFDALDSNPAAAGPAQPPARLRLAIQKSGRLADESLALLARCGVTLAPAKGALLTRAEGLPIDVLRVRDDDIPVLIAQGACDVGFVGRNVLAEFNCSRDAALPALREWRALGFGDCRLAMALPEGADWAALQGASTLRIATSYPGLAAAWCAERGIGARMVVLSGAVEIAPLLGTADCICDLVSSGATLKANGLREADRVLSSQAVLAGGAWPTGAAGDTLQTLWQRLDDALRCDARARQPARAAALLKEAA